MRHAQRLDRRIWVAVPILLLACARTENAGESQPPPLEAVAAPKPKAAQLGGFTEEELTTFSKRFQSELWPLFTRGKNSCVSCHDDDSESQLHMAAEADAAFKRLLVEGRLDPKSTASLLSRVVTPDKKKRMPKPPAKSWTDPEVALLKTFGADVYKAQRKDGGGMDEQFPMELLSAYVGKQENTGPDTTFITYYQLKRKVKAIFNDDWNRNGRDLFTENIALFNGADFVRSYNESSTASATFLSGIDLLGADVATRAYAKSSGPFEGRPATLPSPIGKKSPDGTYKKEINRLFNKILFRDATEQELKDAFLLIQNVYRDEAQLNSQGRELRFELKVEDPTGLVSSRDFTIPVSYGACGLYQEYVNEDIKPEKGNLAKLKLAQDFTFKAKDEIQQFQIFNAESNGNVSLAGIEITGPLPDKTVKTIKVNDPSVQMLGAWVLKDNEFPSYEDQNEDKGNASIAIPVRVDKDGKYNVTVLWRKSSDDAGTDKKGRKRPAISNAQSVLVEVQSYDPTHHALEAAQPVPPKGEAHFFVDETLSNIPYWDLKTSFQFGPNDGVEISNANTKRLVVADAVHFHEAKSKTKIMIRGTEAEGNEKWEEFKPGEFKPYNTFGPKLLADGNAKKGELKLLYKPSLKKAEFKEPEFYSVRLSIPGKAGNETQAPVIVHAQQSSPVLQVRFPLDVRAGGSVTLDASATYNLQRSTLKYMWTQTGGPRAEIADRGAPTVTFVAPMMSAQQAAWEGLCRALLRHPDFLFTRPPSIATTKDSKAKQKLQLVKIAQDLVGRTPSDEELKKLDKGTTLKEFVNTYLDSQEFKDFYFRRIRLVLESHGSDTDDEPTRLWCYVAFNDKPFKEILTADYSVDKNMKPQPRPPYYGKTGLLTMKGFIDGKPGLPHFNYAAVVCEKFLGYVFEVPASIVAQREGATAASTTHPDSTCYSCHKILTPLAFQRTKWTDDGKFRDKDEHGKPIDATDHNLVPSYPFKGEGLEAFALGAQNKERFIRTMIQTHFIFFFGREMRYEDNERGLYRRLWDNVNASNFSIRAMLREMLTSPEYLDAQPAKVSAN